MSEKETFGGKPITGAAPNRGWRKVAEQGTASEFLSLLNEVLESPNVASVRWSQYTPYFNDGDVCEFSVGELIIVTTLDDPDSDDWGDNDCDYEGSMHLRGRTWDDEAVIAQHHYDYATRGYVSGVGGWVDSDPTFPDLVPLQARLNREGGRYENVLKAAFGDHAKVIATRDGFELETYEHD